MQVLTRGFYQLSHHIFIGPIRKTKMLIQVTLCESGRICDDRGLIWKTGRTSEKFLVILCP